MSQTIFHDTLKKRYIWKVMTNIVGLMINVGVACIVPRGLGVNAYGNFNFLTNFFSQVVGFFDMGTSTCFFTKLSQRPKESGLVTFYFGFAVMVSVGMVAFVTLIHFFSISPLLWPGQQLIYVYLAALWGIITWVSQLFNQMADAYGITVYSEKFKILQRFLGLIIVSILYLLHSLDLANYFYSQYVIFIFLGLGLLWMMHSKLGFLENGWKISPSQAVIYVKEFYRYSHPLVIYALIGLIVNIFDRWFLQIYGGSIQQGFFGLSTQLGALCYVFTSALTPLLMREFSIAHGNNDLPQMAVLFRRYIPVIFSVASVIVCFTIVQADKVVAIMGGAEFRGGVATVAIMSIYPLYQTYGQLSGSVFYASGQTALYRNIGIVFFLLGIPLTYFMIAPHRIFGLDAGSTGLALKMVVINILAVNTQLWFNARFLHLAFWKYIAHQILTVIIFTSMAWLITMGIDVLIKTVLPSFFVSGIIYVIGCLCLLLIFPRVFAIKRSDLMNQIFALRDSLRSQTV